MCYKDLVLCNCGNRCTVCKAVNDCIICWSLKSAGQTGSKNGYKVRESNIRLALVNTSWAHEDGLEPMSVLTASKLGKVDVLQEKLVPLIKELNRHLAQEMNRGRKIRGKVKWLQAHCYLTLRRAADKLQHIWATEAYGPAFQA